MLSLAVRAPSVHNSQPWLWRVGDTTVHLYADTGRHLPHTDPDQRDLLLSCGAALHHLQVAARASGWETVIHRLPDPAQPEHLAAIEFRPGAVNSEAERQARAVTARRSDRRRYTSWEVPAAYIAAMTAAGAAHGTVVFDVVDDERRAHLLRAFEQSAWVHARDFAYGAELAQWSGRHATAEGVLARSAVASADATVRPFSNPGLPQTAVRDIDATDRMLVLSTTGDDRVSRVRAGEAAGAVLVTATAFGLASCPLSEPLEVHGTRDRIRTDVLDDSGCPQLIIRIGWVAPSGDPVPVSPRRPLEEVVRSL
ncbi:nitroreductase [Nocardia transvalensis]|uniref:Nitroreductase n=1 Tax=Nocardia transvalensis TaxID=37333 RepID=A0A7W9UKP6_9NOCA|nr:nitroreductase family protein [Nocardia transvalensis]MBB5916714.1 nitroreductase [Nocardia transvalensis]